MLKLKEPDVAPGLEETRVVLRASSRKPKLLKKASRICNWYEISSIRRFIEINGHKVNVVCSTRSVNDKNWYFVQIDDEQIVARQYGGLKEAMSYVEKHLLGEIRDATKNSQANSNEVLVAKLVISFDIPYRPGTDLDVLKKEIMRKHQAGELRNPDRHIDIATIKVAV